MQVTESAVLFQQLGLGLVLADLGLRDPEATFEVSGRLVRLAHALVTLLKMFLERFDGLVSPVDLLLGDRAQGADLVVQVVKLRVSSLHVVTAGQ